MEDQQVQESGLSSAPCIVLYGHPDSGGYWEGHCETQLKAQGFKIVPDGRSCFVHPRLKLLLVVYVDDFKMS
eukprot:10331038-Prorocentrum_lima.AAC.1